MRATGEDRSCAWARVTRRATVAAISALAVATAFGASVALPREHASAGTGRRATVGYGWPLKPFNSPHPVRGNFGDPRTIFHGPPTASTLYHGSGSFNFHRGADIYGPRGARVYPVRSGTVVFLSRSHINVRSADGAMFEYWHIGATLPLGTFVHADKTMLGTIGRDDHVDLTEIEDGQPVNPLAPGHLTPYRDTSHPVVASIRLQTDNAGGVEFPNVVHGSLWLVAEAFDKPTLTVPGAWGGLPVTPALVRWRIQLAHGQVVVPARDAVDFRTSLPPSSAFWSVYARGTFQNMTAFRGHNSYMQPGCYLYLLSPTKFDTKSVPDGIYDLVVTATDIRGNASSRSLRFTVDNRSYP